MAHLSLASESWCHVLSGEHLIIKQGKTVVKPHYPYTHNYLNICPKMLFVGISYILCHWEHLQLHIKITKLVIWRTKIIVVIIYET